MVKKNIAAGFVRHVTVRKHNKDVTPQWLHICILSAELVVLKYSVQYLQEILFSKSGKWWAGGHYLEAVRMFRVEVRLFYYRVPRIDFRKGILGTPGFTRWVKALNVPILVPGGRSLEDVRPGKDRQSGPAAQSGFRNS